MESPTAVVSGANVGIGFNTCLQLSRSGYAVIMACRSESRGAAALEKLRHVHPGANAELEILDLSSLRSVREFAGRMDRRGTPLDLLVNNAAVMAIPERRLSEDGFELQFATNHLGHFALTGLLFPRLLEGRAPRVVTVSSLAHRYGRLNFDDLQFERSYEGWSTYGATKLANLLFAFELDRKCKARGLALKSVACHPGVSNTNILASGPVMGKKAARTYVSEIFASLFAQSDSDGALPVVHASTNSMVKGGEYFGPSGLFEVRGAPGVARAMAAARDQQKAARLWLESEKLTGVHYAGL